MANVAISDLPAATLPLDAASLIEVSVPDGLGGYDSKHIEASDLLSIGGFTLGSTSISPGSTVTTVSGLSEVGIGGSPQAQLHILGTYTTSNNAMLRMNGTLVSSDTSEQKAIALNPLFNPSGASLGTIVMFDGAGQIIGSSLTIPTIATNQQGFTLQTGFSGTVSTLINYNASTPIINGGNLVNYIQYRGSAVTANNGLPSGNSLNIQYHAAGITAGTAGGTLTNTNVNIIMASGGSSSGTTNNNGIRITGNGGTASGSGTVNNRSISNESTALSYFAGPVSIGSTTSPGTSNLSVTGTVRVGGFTVATLPAAGTAGRCAYVTDANATLAAGIGTVVAGGGANVVPVFDDGTNWRIG